MFHQQDHLKAQLQECLPGSRQLFQCQDCGKQYNTQLDYRCHLVTTHSAAGGLPCPEEPPSLLETLSDHSDRPPSSESSTTMPVRERKYSCERCDRRFYTRKDVRRHAVVHTGRRDFLCTRCAQRFGRRDHLTRHLKKSHAQESGMMSPAPPSATGAAQTPTSHCTVKEEPGQVSSDPTSVTKEPMESFVRDLGPPYSNPVPGMGHSQGLMQGLLPSPIGVGHHVSTQSSHPQPLQPPAAPQQQSYSSTSYSRSDMENFLLDLQSAPPPPQLCAVNTSTSASPQREGLGEGDPHLLCRSPALSTTELSCPTNMELGPLLSFLPFSLPPYSSHMGVGGLVMSYPPAASTTSPPSSSTGIPSQTPGPFSFFQPPQAHIPQAPGAHSQLPQAYTSAMSTSSSLPHYYQAFQQ